MTGSDVLTLAARERAVVDHVLRNGSGSVRRKIEDVFGNTLSDRDKRSLATLIYYPQEKMDLVRKEESDIKDWYRMTLYRLIEVSKRAASKYTRSKVRKSLPKDYAYVIEELITEKAEVLDKEAYYSEIVNTIIDIERAESFIVALCELIQRLVVDHLHIVGDIYDRGPGPHFIMDKLMEYHSIDIQWGNHDMTMFNTLGVPDNEQIEHKMLSSAIEKAQMKIEGNNFGIRKNLLEYDQVMMKRSYSILKDHPLNLERKARGLNPANSVWFWGAGTRPTISSFEEKHHKRGVMISAVDLLKGIAIGAGMDIIKVEGANGGLNTNYKGKAEAAIHALFEDGYDFAYIHIEAPDEMGHQGNAANKIEAIERIDRDVIATLKARMDESGEPYRLLYLPDHPTPICKRTHTNDSVPYLLYDSEKPENHEPGGSESESVGAP